MFKPVLFIVAASAAATLFAVPLASQTSSQDIVVSPRSSAAFAQEVGSDLNGQLARMRLDPRWDEGGIVKLRFRAGKDGTPTDIATYQSSGNRSLDRKSRKAVERLTSLAPLPSGARQSTVIQANIIVAYSDSQMKELSRKLARSEAARLASNDPAERAVLALGTIRSSGS